jgi:hypothetical protein
VSEDASSSLLFRLVDVAARTLEAASAPEGHLARRYVSLLRGMAGIVMSDNMQTQRMNVTDTNNLPEQLHSGGEVDLWQIWQQAGLDPIFYPSLFDDTYVG